MIVYRPVTRVPAARRPHKQLRLHFIVGATGVGKTAAAVTLAEHLNAPVLAMDRLQIYRELATGTGRPETSELRGTLRIYLADRRIADGELPAAEAHQLLVDQVQALRPYHSDLILEGGSISLFTELCRSSHWEQYPKTVRNIVVRGPARYCARIRHRIEQMLRPAGSPSVLAELAAVWRDARVHALVQSVVGYDAILAWCQRRSVAPTELAVTGVVPRHHLYEIGDEMLAGHLKYARLQAESFDRLLPQLLAMGAHMVGEPTPTQEQPHDQLRAP